MTLVRVYNGEGSIKSSVDLMVTRLKFMTNAEVQTIDSSEIRGSKDWAETASHIIFAGASVRGFKKALENEGLKKLYNAVAERGVTYVGVCAGAAFAAKDIAYDVFEEGKRKKLQNQGLGFFNGYARGPIKDIAGNAPHDNTLSDIHVIDVRRIDTHRVFKAAYWSGPSLIPASQNAAPEFKITSVLNGNGTPLSVAGTHGKGKVILYAFHPEIALWNFRQWIHVPNPNPVEQMTLSKMDAYLDGAIFEPFALDIGLEIPNIKKAEGLNLSALY